MYDEGLVITGLEPFGVGFCLILAGLVILTANVFDVLGQGSMVHGVERLFTDSDPELLVWIPTDTLGIPPLVVLTFALYQKETYSLSAIMTFLLGLVVWAYDMVLLLNPEHFPNGNMPSIYLPLPLVMLLLSTGTYLICHYGMRLRQNVEPYSLRSGN